MLQIHDLSCTYPGGVRALDHVSLNIGRGLFGLLGPNGAGKSTLMRILATLQEPDMGQVMFGRLDVLRDPESHRRHLGYLPQDFGVYPGISAEDLLDHLGLLKGITDRTERREQVQALLQQVNLYEQRKRAVAGFSGGMRQRFGIAQALLGAPRLVIVDEPTAGLDPEERNRFLNLLAELGEDIVVILSTHLVEDVRSLCADMAILHQGRVMEHGAPEALVRALDGKVWRKAIGRHELAQYRESHVVLSSHLAAARLSIRVLAQDQPGAGFDAVEPDLEDVYFAALALEPVL